MANVRLEGVSKNFGTKAAVKDLTLNVADGEFIVLLGPTGAGKTTTLRLAAGLETCDTGRILVDGRDVTGEAPSDRNVAFVFQQYSLYPHLSVFDNLAFPLRSPARRVPENEIKQRVQAVAEMLRIPHKLQNRATQLSGGEMQRVAIGRALVREPSIYLMDEPLSSLDAKLRGDMRIELKRIQQELGATILYVTHDQIEAMTMANRVGVISDGKLIQVGSPRQVYEDPQSVYVAQRLGQPQINLLTPGLVPHSSIPKAAATIGVRTEHIAIAKAAKAKAHGTVEWIEHLGDQTHLHVRVQDKRITTLADADTRVEKGDMVSLKLTKPLFFDAAGERIRS